MSISFFMATALLSTNATLENTIDCDDTQQCIQECIEEKTCAYTYPFYSPTQCWGAFVEGEYLCWYSKDSNLLFTQELQSIRVEEIDTFLLLPTFFSFPTVNFSFKEKWDPGLRIGIGIISSCDGWDFSAYWTYFKNSSKRVTSVTPFESEGANSLLLNPWSNPIFGTDFHFDPFDAAFYGFAPFYTQMIGEWKEKLNLIDGEIGRKFYLSSCMTLRPYFGVRGAWDQNDLFITSALETVLSGIISTNAVIFKNRFSGAGILGGLQATWGFNSYLSVFANLDYALLWGKAKIKRTEVNTGTVLDVENLEITIPPLIYNQFTMQSIFDLALGLRFEVGFCCDRYRLGADIGWEQHIWFDHNQRILLRNGIGGLNRAADFSEFGFLASTYDTTSNNFIFGGLVVKGRFTF